MKVCFYYRILSNKRFHKFFSSKLDGNRNMALSSCLGMHIGSLRRLYDPKIWIHKFFFTYISTITSCIYPNVTSKNTPHNYNWKCNILLIKNNSSCILFTFSIFYVFNYYVLPSHLYLINCLIDSIIVKRNCYFTNMRSFNIIVHNMFYLHKWNKHVSILSGLAQDLHLVCGRLGPRAWSNWYYFYN